MSSVNGDLDPQLCASMPMFWRRVAGQTQCPQPCQASYSPWKRRHINDSGVDSSKCPGFISLGIILYIIHVLRKMLYPIREIQARMIVVLLVQAYNNVVMCLNQQDNDNENSLLHSLLTLTNSFPHVPTSWAHIELQFQ